MLVIGGFGEIVCVELRYDGGGTRNNSEMSGMIL